MSRRNNTTLALLLIAACGGAGTHDATSPAGETATCPSEAAPERCGELADAAAKAGKHELAWAYTVLECESPSGGQCAAMWQRFAKDAPTQTDALDVLHAACAHDPAACVELAAWHTQRGHVRAAAAYQKRAAAEREVDIDHPLPSRADNTLALATDLAAVMHVSDAPPRTDAIAQVIGHELRAPVVQPVAAKPKPKAWPMHAAALASSSSACATTARLDQSQVPLAKCVSEVRPLDGEQIAIRNRCGLAITVVYAGARSDHSTYTHQLELEPYEALGAGISHGELGPLTYAVCASECRITSSPDDLTSSWNGQDATYDCSKP